MTTIGTAVLQIIPSLKGVTDAIEKQIDGKVVEVKVAPKVDQAAAKKAGKDAGDAIAKEAKDAVSKGEIGKAVADDVKTSVKKSGAGTEIAKLITADVKRSSPGRDIAKVIVEGLADGVKQGLPVGSVGSVIVDGIADGMKKGNLAGAIKDAVLPSITQIGTQISSGAAAWSQGIADALRSGDIQGATDEIGNTVRATTGVIASIGSTFGLQLDDVQKFGDGSATTLETVGSNIQSILGKAGEMKSSFADTGELLGNVLPGRAGSGAKSIINSLGTIVPIASGVYDALNKITQDWHAGQQERFWQGWAEDQRAIALGVKPPQPGVGDFGGAPAVGQGNAPAAAPKPRLGDDLRAKVAAGQLPGYSLAPNGAIIGPDGKPLPGFVVGGAISGAISGLGSGISDSILARVSNGEFIVNADATRKTLPLLEAINSGKLPGFAGGGLVAGDEQLRQIIMDRFGISDIGGYRPADKYGEHSTGRALDVMVGANKGKGDAVKDFALANANAIDLKWVIWQQHLFYPGGGGYDMPDRGSPTQNHRDHVHIFSGTGIVNGLRGALAGGPSGVVGSGVGAPGVAAVAGGPGAEDTSSADQTGGAGPLPSSISGLASFGLNGLGGGVGTTGSGSDLSLFGNAAASAVSGQVSSALGVFGVNDSPGWLKAATMLVGGLKVGGHGHPGQSDGSIFNGANPLGSFGGGGHSAAPISATPTATGTPPPDNAGNVHGTRAGQPAGPGVVYNIRTATVEDAFLQARRRENERAAAQLSRF